MGTFSNTLVLHTNYFSDYHWYGSTPFVYAGGGVHLKSDVYTWFGIFTMTIRDDSNVQTGYGHRIFCSRLSKVP